MTNIITLKIGEVLEFKLMISVAGVMYYRVLINNKVVIFLSIGEK